MALDLTTPCPPAFHSVLLLMIIRMLLHSIDFPCHTNIVVLDYMNNPDPGAYLRVYFMVLFLVQLLCLRQETAYSE